MHLQKEKERAEEQERNRIRMTKELAKAKREMEDAETRRFIEQQKKKKLEEEQDKRKMMEQLARDKEERFGKKFEVGGVSEKKPPTPLEDVQYYCQAIIKLYPTFRCGDQAKNCLNLIKVAISNIIKNPDEDKFKKIKMTNPTVQERLGKISLGMKLIKSLGFKEDGEFYVLEKVDDKLLHDSLKYLEDEVAKIVPKQP